MASSNQLDTTTILLLILGAIILLPLLTMGMGFGGMMGYGGMVGYGGTTSGWWPFVGMLFPLIFLPHPPRRWLPRLPAHERNADVSGSRDGGTPHGVRSRRPH